jgi:hypothetical protein
MVTPEEKLMKSVSTQYLANDLVVAVGTIRPIAGKLHAAQTAAGETAYFLQTNGDPFVLPADPEDAWYFVTDSGMTATELLAEIRGDTNADPESRDAALDTLLDADAKQRVLEANPHDVEQTYYGFRARVRDEAGQDRGGWLTKGERSEAKALYDLADYLQRRP